MGNMNAQMAEFVGSLWENYIKQKHDEASADVLSYYRAEVVSNDGNNRLTIQKPFDNPYQVSCTDDMSEAVEGMQVIVLRFGNGTNNANHIVVAKGNGSPIGSGGIAVNGLPTGGTAGQILVKNSSTNFDTAWTSINTASRYVHEQGTASATWTVNHNLNCYPSVTVVDTANTVVVGEVQYTNTNSLTITFNAAVKGKAYIN